MRSALRAALASAALVCLAPGGARAQEDAPPTPPASDDELRIRGIFNSALPGTERKSSLKLILHPHLGDLVDREYLRAALGLRYGLSERWEATAETEVYLSHGMRGKQGFLQSVGISGFHVGTKYALGDPLGIGWEASLGLDWHQPLGGPPEALTDGLRHAGPFLTASRQLESNRRVRLFFGAAYDDVARTSVPGRLEKNALGESSVSVSGGALYESGPVTYTLEAAYATARPIGGTRDSFVLRPGIVWLVPARYTFGLKGRSMIGFGLAGRTGADGTDVGINLKVRLNFDFKKLLGRGPTGGE